MEIENRRKFQRFKLVQNKELLARPRNLPVSSNFWQIFKKNFYPFNHPAFFLKEDHKFE
jgi:hypothetical protein